MSDKMFAVVSKSSNDVVMVWIGEDESKSDHDRNLWYFVEMNENNSPAYCPGKYINGNFEREI